MLLKFSIIFFHISLDIITKAIAQGKSSDILKCILIFLDFIFFSIFFSRFFVILIYGDPLDLFKTLISLNETNFPIPVPIALKKLLLRQIFLQL